MSLLTNMYTFAPMENAVVVSSSSENVDHPAEHAISPLEPNFAWEANQASAQHLLTVDLTEPRSCDGFSFIHHEAVDITVTAEASDDNASWFSCVIETQTVPDSTFIRIIVFTSNGSTASPYTARYWRFTVQGTAGAPNYAPTDCRISMCWLFNHHEFDRGAGFPLDDTPTYPSDGKQLSYGKIYRTGWSVNPHVLFTRTWMLTEIEYTVLMAVLRDCNGMYRPFILVENDNVPRLCKFASDEIKDELLDVGLQRVTCKFVEPPIVQRNEYH